MAADQQRLFFFASILCAGVSYWFYVNLEVKPIHMWDLLLADQRSGERRTPIELLHLKRVLNYTSEYIGATNAQERLHDLKYQLDFEKMFVTEQYYSYPEEKLVSGWPVANQKLCGAQLDWILTRLAENANYTFLKGQLGFELTSLMDSFGRPEANTYAGIVSWLGSYERCLATSLDGGSIRTRYCEARMRPKWWPKHEAAPMIPPSRIRVGVCLPETCDTMSLEHHRPAIERLAKFQLPELYKSGLDLMDLFCLPDERSPIRQLPLSGRIFLVVVGSWIALVAAGTILDESGARQKKRTVAGDSIEVHQQTKTAASSTFETREPLEEDSHSAFASLWWWELVEAMSLRRSLKAFTSNPFRVRYDLGHRVRVDLSCLDFFKILMHMLIVLGHSFYLPSLNMRNLVSRIEFFTNERARALMSLARSVETFYVFYGMLTTYNLMRKFKTRQLANPILWLGINLRIFLRVAPIFMLVYCYSRTVSPYTGAGPWWDYGVDKRSMKGLCLHEPWLKSIPYLGQWDNYVPGPPCNMPSWFIVSYVQLAALLPLITYLLCRLPHSALRLCLVGFLSVASALNIGLHIHKQTSVSAEGFTLYGGFLFALMEKFESVGYTSALSRLSSVSIGCLVGYLLRQYESGAISRWPNWLLSRITLVVLVAANLMVFFLPLLSYWSYLNTRQLMTMNQVVVGNVVIYLLWPTLNGMLICLLATNHYCHTALVRFFSHSFWYSANRLGFCIFLIHWELIQWTVTGHEQAAPVGFDGEIWRIWALATLQSVALAFFIHLFFEAPLFRLTAIIERTLLGVGRQAKKDQQEAFVERRKSTSEDSRNNEGKGTPAEMTAPVRKPFDTHDPTRASLRRTPATHCT